MMTEHFFSKNDLDAGLLRLTTRTAPVKVIFSDGFAAHNTLGYYSVNEDGAFKNPRLIFPDTHPEKLTPKVSSAFLGDRPTGKSIGFFVIEDGFSLNAHADWFADATLNRGGTFCFVKIPDFPFDGVQKENGKIVWTTKNGSVPAVEATVKDNCPVLLWIRNDESVCVAAGKIWHGHPSVWSNALNPSDAFEGKLSLDEERKTILFSLKNNENENLIELCVNAGEDNFNSLAYNRIGAFANCQQAPSTIVSGITVRSQSEMSFDMPPCAGDFLKFEKKPDNSLHLSGDMSAKQAEAALMRFHVLPKDNETQTSVDIILETSRGTSEYTVQMPLRSFKTFDKPSFLSTIKDDVPPDFVSSIIPATPPNEEENATSELPAFLFEDPKPENEPERNEKPKFSLPLMKKTPVSEHKTVLITGGAKRIGKTIALHAAKKGWNVIVHCRSSLAQASRLVEEIRDLYGVKASYVRADFENEDDTQSLIKNVIQTHGAIDALVNNASVFVRDDVSNATAQTWNENMAVNLRAPFILIQEFAKTLEKNKTGVVVNMLDERVLNLTPHFTTYTLSKAGLATLTKTLALALAPKIRVNAVALGDTLPAEGQTKFDFERRVASSPLGEAVDVENVARAVLFLLNAPHTTGTILPVDAGRSLEWSPEKNP